MTTSHLALPAGAVVAAMRRQLVHEARHDLIPALPAAVAFVWAHPDQADVLSELGAIAGGSLVDLLAFRAAVGDLLAAAGQESATAIAINADLVQEEIDQKIVDERFATPS